MPGNTSPLSQKGVGCIGKRSGIMGFLICLLLVAPGSTNPLPFRAITYNVHGFWAIPKKNAPPQKRVAEEIAIALQGYAPFVITLQEAADTSLVDAVATGLGMKFVSAGCGASKSVAMLTSLPIVSWDGCPITFPQNPNPDDPFSGRAASRMVVEFESGQLIIWGLHLRARPEGAAIRKQELDLLLPLVKKDIDSGVPVILQGDLNHEPADPEYSRWKGIGLVDLTSGAGKSRLDDNTGATPTRKIDYIWASASFANRLPTGITLYERPFRADLVSNPKSYALSDHLPVALLGTW